MNSIHFYYLCANKIKRLIKNYCFKYSCSMADLLIWKLNNKAHKEHLDKETNDYNQHTESTKNDLESLELSTIDHNDTESYGNRVNGRMTCSSKLSVAPQKILPNNKSSRSPLATNNSINEGTDQVNVFSGDDTAEKAKRMK